MSDQAIRVGGRDFATMTEWRSWIDAELGKEPVTVSTNKGSKGTFESLSISYVRVRMGEIFGLSYNEEVLLVAHGLHQIKKKTERAGREYETYTAWGAARSRVTITLPWGVVVREALGTCDGINATTPRGAIDMAFKGAASDAFKVACRGLGRTFGLELRLKEEEREGLEEQREAEPEGDDRPADPWGERDRQQREDRERLDRDRQRRDDERSSRPAPRRDDDRDRGRDDDRDRSRRNDDRGRDGGRYESERSRTDRRAEESRRDLDSQREAAFGRDSGHGDDPTLDDLVRAGWDRRMASGLSTLPADKKAPEDALKDLWDMGVKLYETAGLEGDAFDWLWRLVEDELKIDSKQATGRDARRIAVAIMEATKPKERSR